MEKKNTILLTVIAVATLLVAVVGASFAFFAIETKTEDSEIKVETTTAKASDSFVATASDELKLDVTNDVMKEVESQMGKVAVTDDATLKVELTAGSTAGAKCTYHILYAGSENYTMTTGAADGLEYTIQGTMGANEISERNITSSMDLGEFTIEVPASQTAAGQKVTQNWTFTANFYNLAINQGGQMNKTFTGNLRVDNVDCKLVEAE